MIEFITIKNVATYGDTPQTLGYVSPSPPPPLPKINFLFGSNGSGKTTISKIIANERDFPGCTIKWNNDIELETMVYNRDFVDLNFNQSTEIKGVFTLGKEQQDIRKKINLEKKEVKDLETKIENLTLALHGNERVRGKRGELTRITRIFNEKCWSKKNEYKEFGEIFRPFSQSMEIFKQKILDQRDENKAELLTFEKLDERTKSIFVEGGDKKKLPLTNINTAEILLHETNELLKKKIIGKKDVDIAAMIKILGNSDWVEKGRKFYDVNNEVCPFCQQKTNKEFSDSLNQYFDETFQSDTKAIDDIKDNYDKDVDNIQKAISSLMSNQSGFLKIEELQPEQELLQTKINDNKQKIAKKQREPSQIVELDSLDAVLKAINDMIDNTNQKITAHNDIVGNIEKLKAQVWKFVVEEMKDETKEFEEDKNKLEEDIAFYEKNIKSACDCKKVKSDYIQELEGEITSVQPTIEGMNHLLKSFGFKGFEFAIEGDTSYKIVRLDGTDVKNTLSEGERNFVTFLYFYHLIKGSDPNSGKTIERIVVFDDPVSSIDSDILWIVSSLIRSLFEKLDNNPSDEQKERIKQNEHIKQIFVFTHNVYFHKEVSYLYKCSGKKQAFWMVRKPDQYSKIERCDENPVKSSYQLLWEEVKTFKNKKEGEQYSNVAIQNTLRRILECYFQILGNVNINKIHEKFDDQRDRLICKSLTSWINDGSHFADESMEVSNNDLNINSYLDIFRKVFCELNQDAHYKMMIKE